MARTPKQPGPAEAAPSIAAGSPKGFGIDVFLERLVQLANADPHLRVPITLSYGGALVTGHLVGGSVFFDALTKQIRTGPSLSEKQKALIEHHATTFRAGVYPDRTPATSHEELERSVDFVHLLDARFYTPGAPAPTPHGGMGWRGALDYVDGWSFGTLPEKRRRKRE